MSTKILGGYTGQVLNIDLSNETFHIEPLPSKLVENYLGGAGINAAMAYELLPPKEDPFSEQNCLIFGAGPMVGTMVPGSGKCNLTSRSPNKKFIGVSGHGLFGMIKFAGFDHVIITGKSENPVYLKIVDDKVTFHSAEHIWGMDVFDTTHSIWNETDDDFYVTCIGPAGENKVQDASIITNKYATFARTGMGAVMGSKNLKAIAVAGTGGVNVSDRLGFFKIVKKIFQELRSHPNLLDWRKYGTLISFENFAQMGVYAAKNLQLALNESLLETFPLDQFISEVKENDVACLACPVGCKHHLRLQEGKLSETSFSVSCMNSVIQSFGCFCLAEGWEAVSKCAETAARLGLDFMSSGSLISFSMELYQRGLLNKEQTDGLELKWGDTEVINALLHKMAFREGIGDVLAEGLFNAPARLGPEVEKYAMQVKGLGILYDPRSKIDSTEIFSQLSNVRGYVSNVSIAMVPRTPEQIRRYCKKVGLSKETIDRIVNDKEYNVARLNKWTEDITSLLEFLGICQFPLFQRIPLSTWAELYTATTGIETTYKDLIKQAENVWDLKRAYNLREGASRKDDSFPDRFFSESVPVGNNKFPPLNRDNISQLLSDYYEERGWDRKSGEPSKEKLKSLGIK